MLWYTHSNEDEERWYNLPADDPVAVWLEPEHVANVGRKTVQTCQFDRVTVTLRYNNVYVE